VTASLRRSLGLTHATAMVVGTIVGASIFVQPSEIARQMRSVAGIAAGALTLCRALICAELASAHPRTGGRPAQANGGTLPDRLCALGRICSRPRFT